MKRIKDVYGCLSRFLHQKNKNKYKKKTRRNKGR